MAIDTAELVLAVITGVGFAVWIIGLRFVLASRPRDSTTDLQTFSPEDGYDRWLHGSVEVEGEPHSLARKAASLLIKDSSGPIKILALTDDRVQFERVGPSGLHQAGGNWFGRGEFRFLPLGHNRTRVEYAIEWAAPSGFLWAACIIQAVGLIGLIAGCWLIYTFVVFSPNPAIRWQTVQMAQVVHFLWPPFLFAGLYRRGRREVKAKFEALTNNLPYHAE
jgi:hypothetical protein